MLSITLSLIACGFIGFINGFLIYKFRLNSILLTLGTMILVRGLVNIFVQKLGGYPYPDIYKAISRYKVFDVLHLTIIIMIIAVILLEVLLRKNVFFKKIYFIGDNIASARIYGLDADAIKMTVFIISGVCAGIAGILTASRSGQTVFSTGQGLEFKMITAALLGGASLYGGRGSILKVTIGLFFLSLILNGMIMYGIDPQFQPVIVGSLLILAIYIDSKFNTEVL